MKIMHQLKKAQKIKKYQLPFKNGLKKKPTPRISKTKPLKVSLTVLPIQNNNLQYSCNLII